MKKTGKCPKCGSTEIYTDGKDVKRSERNIITVTSFMRVFLNTYICTSCGYVEEYAENVDEKKLEKIKEKWRKVF
jgi:predicted nucleic-acid-binding Zn-ribbon protein